MCLHTGKTSRDGSPERFIRVWYGWDGDRLTTTQTDITRIQTVYLPGSFTPLLRIETTAEELQKATRRSLAEKLQQDGGVTFPPELVALLDGLEGELLSGDISEQRRQWLAQCGLTAERMRNQLEPVHIPQRTIHLYHCDHRGLPLALINEEGHVDWSADYDAWGSLLSENNPHSLVQDLRLPGQQYDKETGLHYNRHRYYNPRQGRYITQDPIGLSGGWNTYVYPLNPVQFIDPPGLNACDLAPEPTALCGNPLFTGGMGSNTILDGLGPRVGLNGSGSMAGAGAIGGGAIGITSNTDVYDKSGLKVSPNAINMQPPGNCGPGEQKKMQEEVNGWCKGKQTPTSCRGISSPAIRSAIAEVNRQCAIARDNINKQCFSGGDMTHRNQAIDAWNKYSECQ